MSTVPFLILHQRLEDMRSVQVKSRAEKQSAGLIYLSDLFESDAFDELKIVPQRMIHAGAHTSRWDSMKSADFSFKWIFEVYATT
jgi:hypothetical protein